MWSVSCLVRNIVHGVAPKAAITPVAITERLDGNVGDRPEHVVNQQYRKLLCSDPNRLTGVNNASRYRQALARKI
jgi:hypothetical protein